MVPFSGEDAFTIHLPSKLWPDNLWQGLSMSGTGLSALYRLSLLTECIKKEGNTVILSPFTR